MSRSDSVASVDPISTIKIEQRSSGLAPNGSGRDVSCSYVDTKDYLHQPKPQQQLSLCRHYATLQAHADSVFRGERVDIDAPTPRHEARRGSFSWGSQTAYEKTPPLQSRNPMMPQSKDTSTPPTMEELVRRATNDDDTSSTRRSSLIQSDAVFSRPSTRRSSTSGTDVDSLTRTDTEKSVGGFVRSLTGHVPDVRTYHPTVEKTLKKTVAQNEEQSDHALFPHSGKRTRRLSFQLPSGLKMKTSPEVPQKPSPVIEESSACVSPAKPASSDTTPRCSGLAARRQIKMDLILPIGPPDLSDPNDRKEIAPGVLSSITPSRPRSPETPWIREKELNWGKSTKSKYVKTVPIVEEDQVHTSFMDVTTLSIAGREPEAGPDLPGVTAPFESPTFVRPPQKLRDRCYTSRPTTNRSKSGGPSTSESDFGSTPDGHWTPEGKEGMTEQEARVQSELIQLARTSKSVRSRRWPWNKSKASGSDEQAKDEQAKDERTDNRKGTSASLFKRSNRFPETPDKEKQEKRPSKSRYTSWRRERPVDKPPLPSASLANVPVPPIFVPPGCEKVPTPPMFDSNVEVRGKLADFFFESGGFSSARRKPKTSPGGYWDSDAVLMSMQTDLGLTNDEDDEEGPEGRPPAAFHFGPVNDTPGPLTSPGFYTGADGYLTVKGLGTGATPLTPGPAQDSWFRMHYGDHSPIEESFTAAALKEADERRKFEWLVPEHLPNSPLCPLHVKYVGPSKGLCYWHGRKSNGWGIEPGRDYVNDPMRIGGGSTGGWEKGKSENPKGVKKKRRLQSLSDPC